MSAALDEIAEDVEALRLRAGDDPEENHAEEDGIHEEALRKIAAGAPDAVKIAEKALETCGFDFPRWCA